MRVHPVYVLVHGAWDGGWIWARVAQRLRAQGATVLTPTLTGCGERFHLLGPTVSLETHVTDVLNVLNHEDLRDVVLVGHSYGGTVATGVADRDPARIRRLVYLDASAPIDGQNATGAFAGETAVELGASGDSVPLAPPLPCAVLGVSEAADVAWVDAHRHPHPLRTLQEPLRLTGAGAVVPRSYIRCTRHEGLVAAFGVDPLASFVARAEAERWPLCTLDAPHAAHVVAAPAVTEVLLGEGASKRV
jgi:pimeloyl-ACP methyl ester carboxylesterase